MIYGYSIWEDHDGFSNGQSVRHTSQASPELTALLRWTPTTFSQLPIQGAPSGSGYRYGHLSYPAFMMFTWCFMKIWKNQSLLTSKHRSFEGSRLILLSLDLIYIDTLLHYSLYAQSFAWRLQGYKRYHTSITIYSTTNHPPPTQKSPLHQRIRVGFLNVWFVGVLEFPGPQKNSYHVFVFGSFWPKKVPAIFGGRSNSP